ncbi:MAG TPA: MBL fold metallo-hydrolase [Thermoanaerobaculia bacterium]|jgi:glyoxylase-like metal-dependent hydrolase (beta-lactamase superfamily II)|nr:MBL fold metallo-hydrolase [Thermoanaerobaculia bacterium]
MELGDFRLSLVSDGGFRLDGGAMFGVVPRTLWEKPCPPDERNRIRMATNCLLVERGGDLLLIDTGIGDKHDARFQANFAMEAGATRLPESIRQAGYELEDVTHVLLSHLHFDHCGWSTRERGGRLVPTFPKARYWMQRGEVEHARHPNERDRASYDPRNWEPLFEAGVVELFGDEGEPLPGIKAVRAPGHNADMCIVLMDGGEDAKAVYWADLVPTTAHVPYPWIMGYDLYPLTTLENKKIWLPRAAEGGWLCVFEHDPDVPFARLVEEKPGRYKATPELLLPREIHGARRV